MSPSKPANSFGNYAVGSAIAALILLGPVAALLMVITAEMLIDLLIMGGTSAGVRSRGTAASDWSRPASSGNIISWRTVRAGNWYAEIRPCCRTDVMRPTAGSVSLCNVDECRPRLLPAATAHTVITRRCWSSPRRLLSHHATRHRRDGEEG